MTPEAMRTRSSEKVRQVTDLMKVLSLRIEARERVNEQGFIEKLVFWIDDEAYAPAEPIGPSGETPETHV